MARARRKRKTEQLPPEHYENLAKKPKGEKTPRGNHAGSTQQSVTAALKKWQSYSNGMNKDPDELMGACQPEWFKNYLEWLLDNGQISKRSTLQTHWRFLRLGYVRKYGKMNADVSLELTTYLDGPLTQRHGLDKSPKPRPVMDVNYLFSLLHYHWTCDTEIFPHERYRVQLPLLILLTAYTSSRPGTLVECGLYAGTNEGLHYRDIRLSLLRNPVLKDGDVLVLEVTCRFIKGERNGKPKTYVMHERDDNPVLCPILHFLSLAFADNAFRAPDLTPENFFSVFVPPQRNSIEFQWKESILNTPVFRRTEHTVNGTGISPYRCLSDKVFRDQLRRLGLSAGFKDILTPYAIRRGTGNAVDSVATSAERNQVMGHSRDDIFLRHYISQTVKVDVQSAFLGCPSRQELLKTAGKLSRWRDSRAPMKLTSEERKSICAHPEVQRLRKLRNAKTAEIRKLHGTVKAAKGTAIHEEYTKLQRALAVEIMNQHELRLQEARDEFFQNISGHEIQLQISTDKTVPSDMDLTTTIEYELEERGQLARLLFEPIPVYKAAKIRADVRRTLVENITKLCNLRESRCADGTDDSALDLSVDHAKVEEKEDCIHIESYPTTLPATQCLFCLADESLSLSARTYSFSRPDSLKRHVQRNHFKCMDANQSFYCPHPTCSQKLNHRMHFLNHAAQVHNVFM
ncbi:hypothetical protein K440DRAFT_113864 [Wilcoxina mikolae CBS 423.85]|nr:hypothetical protein K440DRAFT_113864 [Wilcoxina mikolae CBS 423.85]